MTLHLLKLNVTFQLSALVKTVQESVAVPILQTKKKLMQNSLQIQCSFFQWQLLIKTLPGGLCDATKSSAKLPNDIGPLLQLAWISTFVSSLSRAVKLIGKEI